MQWRCRWGYRWYHVLMGGGLPGKRAECLKEGFGLSLRGWAVLRRRQVWRRREFGRPGCLLGGIC